MRARGIFESIIIILVCVLIFIFGCNKGGGSNDTSNSGTIGYYTVGESGTHSSPWGDESHLNNPQWR